MTIKEYCYLLLPSSMKRSENSDVFKWSNAMGAVLDVVMKNIFSLRTQSMASTAIGKGLLLVGKDEDLEKLSYESDDEYRRRILSIKAIKNGLITKAKLEQAIKTLGYENAQVRECYLEKYKANPDSVRAAKWAEFEVAIPSAAYTLGQNDLERIQYVIDHTRPGWTKGTIIYRFVTVGELDGMTVGQLMNTKIRAFKGSQTL